MPSSDIPAPRTPLTGTNDNLAAREWYRFFLNLTGFTAVATLEFPSTAAGECSDLTMTVPGAADGDVVTLGVPNASVPANGSFFGWVSAPDEVTIRYTNNDLVTAYDPASGVFRAVARRFLA